LCVRRRRRVDSVSVNDVTGANAGRRRVSTGSTSAQLYPTNSHDKRYS